MSLLSWLGRRIRLTDGGFWATYFGGESWSGKTVGIDGAMKLSAWWACTRLISETVATLPIGVYERKSGSKEPRPDHWLYGLLHSTPNSHQTPVEFWEGQTAPVCIIGNSFAEKKFIGARLVGLEPIPFFDCRPLRDSNGAVVYRFTDRNGRPEELPESKVFHIRGFGMGGDMGLSPVAHARETLGGALATEEASARIYGTGLRAAGFMLVPQTLSPEQRAQAQQNVIRPAEGPEGEGKTVFLEAGWRWQPANIPPKDAEMILSRRFNVEDICRWMGVPPILIGHAGEGQTMWGTGIEQIMLGWLTLGLRSYIKRIESAINSRLVPPAEQSSIFVEFNIDGLVRADSAGRAALMSAFAQNGLRTRNELRALDNVPPMAGGDELTVQSNLIPLEQLGRQGQAEGARQALLAWLHGGSGDKETHP